MATNQELREEIHYIREKVDTIENKLSFFKGVVLGINAVVSIIIALAVKLWPFAT